MDHDRIAKKHLTPLKQRPGEIRLSMNGLALAGQPFLPIGFKREILDVIVTGLLPLRKRDCLAVMLAMEVGDYSVYPRWFPRNLPLEMNARGISPQHQDIPSFRTEKFPGAEQTLPRHKRRMVIGRHIGVKQLDANPIALSGGRAAKKFADISNQALVGVEAKSPLEIQP